MPPLPAVLSQHAEDAAFLWLLRDAAVSAPHHDLPSIARLDERTEAHLDGLRVAGAAGVRQLAEQFQEHPEPGEAFAAGVLAFEAADFGAIGPLLAAADGKPELARPFASAVGWLTDDAAAVAVPLLLARSDPASLLVGIAGAAVRRTHPGESLGLAIQSSDSRVKARALRAIGELGDAARLSAAKARLGDPDPAVRFAAAWTAARLGGGSDAVSALQEIAVLDPRFRDRAADLAVRRLDPAAGLRWVTMLERVPGCERVAVRAAGALGDPAAVPRLVEKMAVPALARVAGEAFAAITGVHIAYDKLDRGKPDGFEAGPTDNPADEDVAPDPDGDLTWPDADRVKAWWSANGGRFTRGSRYLCGRPMTPDDLRVVLRVGYQRQRAAAALELAVRQPKEPLYEVRAPGWRQRVG